MGFSRGRMNRLEKKVSKDHVILRMKDGSTRSFTDQEVYKDLILAQMDLFKGEAHPSEVLAAVREATPESRAAFEREYGPIEMGANVVAADYQGGWVEENILREDGRVETVYHAGGSEGAERLRREAREGQSFY